jgi:hypothetical protein
MFENFEAKDIEMGSPEVYFSVSEKFGRKKYGV